MRLSGLVRLFATTPQSPVGADGRMALADHLRELRARVLRSVLVVVVAMVVAFFFYEQLLALVADPYKQAQEALEGDVSTKPYFQGVGTPLLFQLKLSALAAVICTSPIWLYQIWAFILPGLHAHERRWSRIFSAIAGPLFALGVATGYYVLPKGLAVLIGFTPDSVESLVEFGDYFSFFVRMLLIFGVAFEIPVFVVLLSLAGVVSGRALGEHRAWIVVGVFIFAAVATPSTDPFSMLMLAIPMTVLFLVSEVVARIVDRRRSRADHAGLADDEASPLELEVDRSDYQPSRLDED